MDSDDIPSADSAGLLSPWLGSLSAGSTSASASSSTEGFAHTGQLSPISNGVEMPYGAAHNSTSLASPSQSPSVTTQSHSTPSSSARPQAQPSLGSGLGHPRSRHVALLPRAPEGQSTHHQHFAWDEGSDDGLTVPKLEPLDDDDFCMEDLQEAPSPPPVLALLNHPLGAPDQLTQKRPRGRPRKHPLMPNLSTHKITKGRSKTGCLTCRKRKKKCDEAKPRCKWAKPAFCRAPYPNSSHRHELREECRRLRGVSRETTLEEWQGKGPGGYGQLSQLYRVFLHG